MSGEAYMGMGPFSRRVGVSADVLRAWERRYGVPRPVRAANGRRLYSAADEEVVRAMRRALEHGIPAAEAARIASGATVERAQAPPQPRPAERDGGLLSALAGGLRDALTALDEAAAQEQLDRLFGAYSLDAALAEVVLPYLHELGERWACGEVGVGHEHFASNVIHGRLLSLARKWDEGRGPRALLACPAGELHTIGLLCFGLALRARGWRVTYLGADTPMAAVAQVADVVAPARIVLSSVRADVYADAGDSLQELGRRAPLAIAGAGATAKIAERVGAGVLAGDPVTEASRL